MARGGGYVPYCTCTGDESSLNVLRRRALLWGLRTRISPTLRSRRERRFAGSVRYELEAGSFGLRKAANVVGSRRSFRYPMN